MHGLVHFHCHLDLFPDPASAIAEAEASQVYTLTVTTTPRAWPENLRLTQDLKYVRAALGLHPQLVAERRDELALWMKLLPETRYVGEVGLDAGPRFYKSLEAQKEVFGRILKECARAGGKILTVHSVRSATTVLDMIETHLPPGRGTVVMHWFTGSSSEVRRAIELGCYFSVNPAMLTSHKSQGILKALPQGRLLTESDGPFTRIANRPAQPSDMALVVEGLATLRQVSPSALRDVILANLRDICE